MSSSVTLSLDWQTDLIFRNSPDSPEIELCGGVPGKASPTQALAYAVMACMGMDVVHVIRKTRCVFTGMTVRFEGERAADHPRRYQSMRVHFVIAGDVQPGVVARAIDLSRTKYCSVWNSIRPDVELSTGFEIVHPR